MSKPGSTTVDLVTENQQLEEENYAIRRDGTGRLITILIVSVLANAFLIWLAFFHFPKKEFVWTSNAGAVCSVTPISEPHLHPQIIANFAQEAAIGIYSYDYVNYRRSITQTAERYFTPSFRDSFMPMFSDSANLKMVLDNYYIVSAINPANKPVQIARAGRKKGAYFWEIQVPIKVYYASGRKVKDENVLATVTVIRTDPSRVNPTGIAVDYIDTRQMLN